MKRLFGHTDGLKASSTRRLESFYRRRVSPASVVSPELARDVYRISREIRRQVALLINRLGKVTHVIVGQYHGILIPDITDYRIAPDRLRGLRCVHTHLDGQPLTQDDFTDLVLLRLDIMAVLTMPPTGDVETAQVAHILPGSTGARPYRVLPPAPIHSLDIGCLELIQALEAEMAQYRLQLKSGRQRERALLVGVSTESRASARERLDELQELARSGGIQVIGTLLQRRKRIDPRFLLGIGKLQELTIDAMQKGATLIVFDQELNPSQIRSISDRTELKVIDRTQLILDIFAQRAQSKEGKYQVELAQLQYMLPRLVGRNTAMSRLAGGIGGRGPGETKLEVDRRRVRTRIARLEKLLDTVKKRRRQQKSLRHRKAIPVVSIIGYTNAGKSTLLNTLTHSDVQVENRLFATLDPTSRRLRFPEDLEVIITDTVGFIHDLPRELVVAFRATLEELENADLLLHVIDISNPRCEAQVNSVERILETLELPDIPVMRVLNKKDRLPEDRVGGLERRLDGIAVSATDRRSLRPLISAVTSTLRHQAGSR